MVDYDPQIKEVVKGINSTRPLSERFERIGFKIKHKITPESIIRTVRDNREYIEKNGIAIGAYYFIRGQGDSYVIMAYSRETFLDILRDHSSSVINKLPVPIKQWEISKNKLAQYL